MHTDEVGIGYLTFLELYRYEIINLYAKLQGCTIAEAATVVKKGTNHFNSTLYSIMEYMISDPECKRNLWVLVSRNPCINYGSCVMMQIAMVKRDINDKTLTIPSAVIKGMNADFNTIGVDSQVTDYKKLSERLTSGVCDIITC